jgi:hypothetical protein
MSGKHFPAQYVALYKRGPFPGRIDPWAEDAHYFQQIHAGIIGHLLEQVQDKVFEMGYLAGRETSLQIAERREPDLYVQRQPNAPVKSIEKWDYAAAAAAALAEPGVSVDWEIPELHALYIAELGTGELVTIVEVVSPSNKDDRKTILEYQQRRERLVRLGVNIVEIDLTRSVKHLLEDKLAAAYAFHVAVYLPEQLPRLIGMDFGEPLKRVALPLRGEVVAMELQAAYDHAYQVALIPAHINDKGRYVESELPFPTLLTSQQRQDALAAVATWQAELTRLKT